MTVLALSVLAGQAHASSDVYLCVDEQGNKTYKNTGATRGCKKVDLPGITTVPAPPRRAAAPVSAKKGDSPPGFPKVGDEIQKTRDSERRQILLDEKRAEEQKLAELKAEYKSGEPDRRGDERNYAKYQDRVARLKASIEQSEKNLQALDREIANIK